MSRRYTPELKAEVVKALLDEYRPIGDVEKQYQVPRGTFSGWAAEERAIRRRQAEAARGPKVDTERLVTENSLMREVFSSIRQLLVDAENVLDN